MAVSGISNFGPKFCGLLRKHNDTNLLRFLRDVTQNYPLFMDEIANVEPDTISFSRLENLIPQGKSASLINNRMVNLENLDVFTLLDIFNEERNNLVKSTNNSKMKRSSIKLEINSRKILLI